MVAADGADGASAVSFQEGGESADDNGDKSAAAVCGTDEIAIGGGWTLGGSGGAPSVISGSSVSGDTYTVDAQGLGEGDAWTITAWVACLGVPD